MLPLINNILIDQNGAVSTAGLFSLFDLSSDVSKENRIEILSKLHNIYATPVINTIKKNIVSKKYLVTNGDFGIKFK